MQNSHYCQVLQSPMTTHESRMANEEKAFFSLWRDSEASYTGFNLVDLDMPFMLDYGSLVGPVSLTAARAVPRSPGYLPFGLQTGSLAQPLGSNQSSQSTLTYSGFLGAAHR